MRLQSRHGLLLVAALAVFMFVLAWPVGWSESSPLPWDEASHLLGATDIYGGLVHHDGAAMRRAVLGVDQYPPVHSLVLGAWMATFGNHVASWLCFGLLVYVLTAVLLARLHVAAGLLFVGFGMFGGLAPSLMVEPLAVLWVVLALTLLPGSLESRRAWAFLALAWCAAGLALMTKYNFGLPLVAAMVIAGLVRWERRMIVASLVGTGIALGVWALFLSLQDQGWEMFREFARNRTNSAGMSPLDRLGWYGTAFRNQWVSSWILGIGVLLSLGVAVREGLRRGRDPLFVAAAALALGTLVSFAVHPYLLGRNLVILMTAVTVLVGCGMRRVEWRRATTPVHAGVILIALLIIPSSYPLRIGLLRAYFPETARELQPVSRVVEDALQGGGFVRVIGAFNHFSPGWVRLLKARVPNESALAVDVPYPLERSREALDPDWDPAYAEVVASWTTDGTSRVVGIEVESGSPFFDEGYERWNAWKLNVMRAIEESEQFRTVSADSLDVGVRVVVYERGPAKP